MSSAIWALVLLALLCMTLILIGGCLGSARWLISRLMSGLAWSIRAFIRLVAVGSRWLSNALRPGATRLVVGSVEGCRSLWRNARNAQRETSEGGGRAGPSLAKPASAGGWTEEDEAYEETLAVLDLTDAKPLTNALLRQRCGELVGGLGRDGRAADSLVVQEVHAAMLTIRKAHGWRA